MWLRRSFVILISFLVLLLALFFLDKRHVWRKGGTVELVVLIDTSRSVEEKLSPSKDGACLLLGELLPHDRLAVIWFDTQANELYRGTVGSPQVLATVQKQIRSLSASNQDGTVLPEALAKAAAAFCEFTDSRKKAERVRRVLVLFSDGQAVPPSGVSLSYQMSDVSLPGFGTVIALGFEGVDEDRVIRALQGAGATNDVHLVSMDDMKPTIEATLKLLRRAHPLKIPFLLFLGGASLLGVLAAFVVSKWLFVPRQEKKSFRQEKVLTLAPLDRTGDEIRPMPIKRPVRVGAAIDADFYIEGIKEALVLITPQESGAKVETLAGQVTLTTPDGSQKSLSVDENAFATEASELSLEGFRMRFYATKV